jgi:hypothetical protein
VVVWQGVGLCQWAQINGLDVTYVEKIVIYQIEQKIKYDEKQSPQKWHCD